MASHSSTEYLPHLLPLSLPLLPRFASPTLSPPPTPPPPPTPLSYASANPNFQNFKRPRIHPVVLPHHPHNAQFSGLRKAVLRFIHGCSGLVLLLCRMDETRKVEARFGFRTWRREDELSRVLSIVAIWVVDGRTKEFSVVQDCSRWTSSDLECESVAIGPRSKAVGAGVEVGIRFGGVIRGVGGGAAAAVVMRCVGVVVLAAGSPFQEGKDELVQRLGLHRRLRRCGGHSEMHKALEAGGGLCIWKRCCWE
ncbi:uncharacterized protein HKW66_Vig0224860 [Vigna angularis]|uniref:Uncharacterized protein n=1 Tax=Phaseolus angularis TaxID=3914 RepID=A0A8T0JZA2_PHAAN|nr:uncharacterized protein HKW66_Vig0224860 [Vigna angularis]